SDSGKREERADVRARLAQHLAPRSGQDNGRRNPRLGNCADRDPVGFDRPPGFYDRPRKQRDRRDRALSEYGCRTLQLRFVVELCAGSAAGADAVHALQTQARSFGSGVDRIRAESRQVSRAVFLCLGWLRGVQLDWLSRPNRNTRVVGCDRPYSRDRAREAAGLGSPAGGARRRADLIARIGAGEGFPGRHYSARDQSGYVRRVIGWWVAVTLLSRQNGKQSAN